MFLYEKNFYLPAVAVLLAVIAYEANCLQNALTVDEVYRFSSSLQKHKARDLEEAYHVVKALSALGKGVEEVFLFPFYFDV